MTDAAFERGEAAHHAANNLSLAARVAAVLEAVAASPDPIGPRGLARQTGVDRSAVGRILSHLSAVGMVDRDNNGYVPGPRLFALGRVLAARDNLSRAARPILTRLSATFNETCYVCVRRGDTAVLVDGVESTNPVRYVVDLAQPFPLYAGAPGRAILSGLAREEVLEILDRSELNPITNRTITDREALLQKIEDDAKLGYTASAGERIEGGFAVAAPFFDQTGSCAGSIVITCPVSRLEKARIPEFGAAAKAAAGELSQRLGTTRVAP